MTVRNIRSRIALNYQAKGQLKPKVRIQTEEDWGISLVVNWAWPRNSTREDWQQIEAATYLLAAAATEAALGADFRIYPDFEVASSRNRIATAICAEVLDEDKRRDAKKALQQAALLLV
jgi:hypothetical protein